MSVTLVIGGARSGKSRYAAELASAAAMHPVLLATSRAWDEDHQARIRRHQQERGPRWQTIEEEKRLSRIAIEGRVVVVDCVTLWLTNFFVDNAHDPDATLREARAELERTLAIDNTWIFVTNELGQGVHAPSVVGRKFCDLMGIVNQQLARVADRVVLMVAGVPVEVKSKTRQEVST